MGQTTLTPIIKSAGEPVFGLSRSFDEAGPFPARTTENPWKTRTATPAGGPRIIGRVGALGLLDRCQARELKLPRAIALVDYHVRRNRAARKSHAKTWRAKHRGVKFLRL
jgi:hypothetical protein